MEFIFDEQTRTYRTASGRAVSRAELERVRAKLLKESQEAASEITGRLRSGETTTQQWLDEMASLLKVRHQQAFILGRGGVERVTPADRRILESRIEDQVEFLQRFAKEIAEGTESVPRQDARINLYLRSASQSWAIGERRVQGVPINQEKRILTGSDHCDSCLNYAAKGWQLLNSLPDIGADCECGPACNCYFVYRQSQLLRSRTASQQI